MELRSQQRIAAKILKCGVSKIWIDPARLGDVSQAITAYDVRKLILRGVMKAHQKDGLSTYRRKKLISQRKKGRRKGVGSNKGSKGTRFSRKKSWINRIRSQRRILKQLKTDGKLDGFTYKMLYRKASGGFFRGKAHMMIYIENVIGIKLGDKGE
ncbi:MAG: 50S ribosomal protein L19e [Candidatus Aenigmatarchaeota archaeon]